MINRLAVVLALSGCACGVSAQQVPAPVATVTSVQGQVLLSRGPDVTAAQEGIFLATGDRLLALDRSQALIAYADGCEQILGGDSLVTIGERSDCLNARARPLSFRQAIGETGGGTTDDDDDEAWGLTNTQRWLVGIAVAIPIIYAYNNRRDDDRPPVSL